jgi:hypothetical protein
MLPVSCWLLSWLTLWPWRWGQYVAAKHQWISTRLQGITFQKTAQTREAIITSFGPDVPPAARLYHDQVRAVHGTVPVARVLQQVQAGPRLVDEWAVPLQVYTVAQRHSVPAWADDGQHVPRAHNLRHTLHMKHAWSWGLYMGPSWRKETTRNTEA